MVSGGVNMGVIIYPCKIQDKLSKMNSELETLMGKVVTASRAMEKIHTEELSGIAWGNTKDYIASVHQPILQSYRLWGEYEKGEITDIRMQEVCFRKYQN